jgi:hypothetical protein
VLKLARTIADLAGRQQLQTAHFGPRSVGSAVPLRYRMLREGLRPASEIVVAVCLADRVELGLCAPRVVMENC